MRKTAEPSVAVTVRLDIGTHRRRQRLQRQLKCQMPELLKRALQSLEVSLDNEREPKAVA